MRKVFYNNWLAKHFLPFAHTIVLTAFVLTKLAYLPQRIVNHECVHARQWVEMTLAMGSILFCVTVCFDLSVWWMLLSIVAFYLWYILEFLIKFLLIGDRRKAYRNISYEIEARNAEDDNNYLENSEYFSWIPFLFVISRD